MFILYLPNCTISLLNGHKQLQMNSKPRIFKSMHLLKWLKYASFISRMIYNYLVLFPKSGHLGK